MIKETIRNNMITALKQQDTQKKKIYSLALQAIEKAEKDKQREFDDKEIIPLIEKEIKQYEETLSFAKKVNREDIIQECNIAYQILSPFVPQKMCLDDLTNYIKKLTITINPEKSNMGLFMRELSKDKDKIDMKQAKEVLNQILK